MVYQKKTQSTETLGKQKIQSYKVTLKDGACLEFLNYGGAIRQLVVPLKSDKRDVVLGYEDCNDYLKNPHYMGVVIGRYANRIAQGRFVLNGQKYHLDLSGKHHLHGGSQGFSHQFWDVKHVFSNEQEALFELSLMSPCLPNSYPGNLDCKMFYHFCSGLFSKKAVNDVRRTSLSIYMKVLPDQATPLNLTHHSYFNLNPEENLPANTQTLDALQTDRMSNNLDLQRAAVFDHKFQILSNQVSVRDDDFCYHQEHILALEEPNLNFLEPRLINKSALLQDKRLKKTGGYDENYLFGGEGKWKKMAQALSGKSDLLFVLHSTLPSMQFYTSNSLDVQKGKKNFVYGAGSAFCMEPQYTPNSLNFSNCDAPSTIFHAERLYHHGLEYCFLY